jgi:hypothetical protein
MSLPAAANDRAWLLVFTRLLYAEPRDMLVEITQKRQKASGKSRRPGIACTG